MAIIAAVSLAVLPVTAFSAANSSRSAPERSRFSGTRSLSVVEVSLSKGNSFTHHRPICPLTFAILFHF